VKPNFRSKQLTRSSSIIDSKWINHD